MLLVTNIYLNDTLDVSMAPVAFLLVLLFGVALSAEVAVLAGLENNASSFTLAFGTGITLDVNFVNTLSSTRGLSRDAIFFVLPS
jgi:type III secretory pathway component EscV